MSQAQPQSTPPPLPDIVHPTEADGDVDDHAEFYEGLRRATDDSPAQPGPLPSPPEPPSRLPAVRGAYQVTGSNVCWLDSARADHNVWHRRQPSHHAGTEPRRSRPRNTRRFKQVTVKKRYRAGQFIAGLFALMGWLLVAAGLVALWISVFEPGLSVRLGSPNPLGSAGTLIGGLLTVALAVATRAVFDTANAQIDSANAQREMLALAMYQQRARFGAEHY